MFFVTSRRYWLYRPGRWIEKERVCNRHGNVWSTRVSIVVHVVPSYEPLTTQLTGSPDVTPSDRLNSASCNRFTPPALAVMASL